MKNTKIQWADHTFNAWEGCAKVSAGCAHCYAETINNRFGGGNWGQGKPRRRTSQTYWVQPIQWNRDAAKLPAGERPRVFCLSLGDWLDEEVPITWLRDLLALIQSTPNLDWLLLTKRPENWASRLDEVVSLAKNQLEVDLWHWRYDGCALDNVWLGTSVENQATADQRIPQLLNIPARVRFLSAEPLLGPINFQTAAFNGAGSLSALEGLHWIIFGGESGAHARPCNVQWIRDGIRQCRAAGIAPFVKQVGAHSGQVWSNGPGIGLPLPIKDPKGGDPKEWPEDLRVREFPKSL